MGKYFHRVPKFFLSDCCGTIFDGPNASSLTETSPTTHIVPVKDALLKIGAAGALLPSLEARLVDDGGNDVEPGKGIPGEIWIREFLHIYVTLLLIALATRVL
jgi:acyl-CoA synthetase (AMP-forming)/AMP-acid ligase II